MALPCLVNVSVRILPHLTTHDCFRTGTLPATLRDMSAHLFPKLERVIRWFSFLLLLWAAISVFAQPTDQAIYTDSLQNGWANWSWSATLDFANSTVIHSGSRSTAVTITSAWGALYLHHNAFDSTPYSSLSFCLNGGAAGGQKLVVEAELSGTAQPPGVQVQAVANSWKQYTISLSSLGVAGQPNLDGIWFQDASGAAAPVFYLDDIMLVASTNPPPPVTNTTVSISVDAQANQHPISPLIYGVAFTSSNQLKDLNFTANRSGGNSETRYNWQLNAHNHAADWYFESLADSPATPAAAADDFVANSKNGGAGPFVTIPMIGWVPKLGANRARLASYSIAKYGPQTGSDSQWFPDAGNGISSTNGNKPITWNDPNDANFATNADFQAAFIRHLTNRWGVSSAGGVRYYCMDNEHSLWHSTHQDVHPTGATMREIRDRFFDYAGKLKALDPAALVLAPEEWGWSGYFYSGYDQQYGSQHGWTYFPDRSTNGGWDYLPWLLDQFHQRATNTNQRLLDYFTVHYYPQSGEFGNDVSTSMQLLRNRSTRSLWDTNYVDASWINSVVMLIPRLKSWVDRYYPRTGTGITEYNWGAENAINGATAQADLLGIFGREGLDVATRWTTPDPSTPTYKAMKLFRNYDGNKSGFGDVSINTRVPNPDNVSAFAALRSSDGALTLMLINKQLSSGADAVVVITNRLLSGTAQVWQLTSANAIVKLSDLQVAGNRLTNSLPPQSITLMVLPTGAPLAPRLRAGTLSPTNTFDLWLDGQVGTQYILQGSTNLWDWIALQTNTLSSNSWHAVVPTGSATRQFYRAAANY